MEKKGSIGGISIILPVPTKNINNMPAIKSHTPLIANVTANGDNDLPGIKS